MLKWFDGIYRNELFWPIEIGVRGVHSAYEDRPETMYSPIKHLYSPVICPRTATVARVTSVTVIVTR